MSPLPSPRLANRAVLALVAASLMVAASLGTAAAAQPGPPTSALDPATRRAQNEQRRAGLDNEIDALRATDAQVRAQLAAIGSRLATQQAKLAEAQAAAAAATAAFAEAEAAAAAAREEAERTRLDVKRMAIDAFLNPPGEAMATVLVSGSIAEAATRQSVLSVRAEQHADLLERRRVALADLEEKEGAARAAKVSADAARADQQAIVDEIEASRAQQARFGAAIDRRLDASLAEAAGLDALDAKLARQIEQQQADLRRAAEAVGVVAPPPTTAPPPRTPALPGPVAPPPPPIKPPPVATVDTTKVGPFVVNVAIAPQIQALLDAIAPTGLVLAGGAYRDPASQIELRRSHCGPTYYDIYLKPSSQCSPPTARPGSSMHEIGLALDFTCNGTLINSQNSPCFIWLALNAETYGLYNLPSEPWHWSTNGN